MSYGLKQRVVGSFLKPTLDFLARLLRLAVLRAFRRCAERHPSSLLVLVTMVVTAAVGTACRLGQKQPVRCVGVRLLHLRRRRRRQEVGVAATLGAVKVGERHRVRRGFGRTDVNAHCTIDVHVLALRLGVAGG